MLPAPNTLELWLETQRLVPSVQQFGLAVLYSPKISARSNAAIAAMGLPVQLCKKLKIVFAIGAFSNFKPPMYVLPSPVFITK